MPTDQLMRHVGLAQIKHLPQGDLLSSNLEDDLKRALEPSMKAERYQRVWRLSRLGQFEDFLCGKLGFSKSRLTEETFYDEKESDFVTLERDSREGAVSCFVLRIPHNEQEMALLAFEERPPDIYRQSFIGAFGKFLSNARLAYEIENIRHKIDFIPWLDEMDRIIKFSGTFRRPNPRWQPRTEQVRDIIDQTHADMIKLAAKAHRPGQGLNIEESILGGIVEHSKGGYGDYSVRGIRGESEFNYHHGSSEIIEEIIESPTDTVHDIFNKLIAIVRRRIEGFL
jgi:hypothetical protein